MPLHRLTISIMCNVPVYCFYALRDFTCYASVLYGSTTLLRVANYLPNLSIGSVLNLRSIQQIHWGLPLQYVIISLTCGANYHFKSYQHAVVHLFATLSELELPTKWKFASITLRFCCRVTCVNNFWTTNLYYLTCSQWIKMQFPYLTYCETFASKSWSFPQTSTLTNQETMCFS